ncbi:helix-turn-helix domain-containing protein [Herbidospora mongoliensis]|uniref:helix-turn-helix domain-containing protein n=1 Tax=Herbidospora mongoliensis TaxID=688067 RepID=UPI0009FC96E0
MSRYRLSPTSAQEAALAAHCGHARFVWNLAVEQHSCWQPGRKNAPKFAEQCRQLTEARAEHEWLREGSVVVQQQALKDFAQALANFFGGTHRRPTCHACGHRALENRESQTAFQCRACGHRANADVNAARNIRDIAAGHAVNARGGDRITGPVNREPQLALPSA